MFNVAVSTDLLRWQTTLDATKALWEEDVRGISYHSSFRVNLVGWRRVTSSSVVLIRVQNGDYFMGSMQSAFKWLDKWVRE